MLLHRLLPSVLPVLLLTGCRSSPPTAKTDPAKLPPAARHAVHSAQLKDIMNGLNTLTFERLPQELNGSSPRRQKLEEASVVARQMADAAQRIPAALEQTNLTAEEEALFRALSARLESRSLQLKAVTDQNQLAQIDPAMQDISATCVACHTLFRDLSGPGEPLE